MLTDCEKTVRRFASYTPFHCCLYPSAAKLSTKLDVKSISLMCEDVFVITDDESLAWWSKKGSCAFLKQLEKQNATNI